MKLWTIVALEMLLPGGSLLALGLFLYRHRKTIFRTLSIWRAGIRAVGTVAD